MTISADRSSTDRPVQETARVLARVRAGSYQVLTLFAPGVARTARPGQFVAVRVRQGTAPLLRRPFSVHQAVPGSPDGHGGGTIDLVVERVGAGTDLVTELGTHDRIDLVGPLGRPFTLPPDRSDCVLVGGGYGAAPLFMLAEQLRAAGGRPHLVLGAATASRLLKPLEARRLATSLAVTTDDGSAGTRGRVTDVLGPLLARADRVYACGPMPMLAAVARAAAAAGVPSEVAVEEHMGCGTGICFACVVPVRDQAESTRMVRSCLDGPVMDGAAVAWDELGFTPVGEGAS